MKRFRYWLPVILVSGTIFILSCIPGGNLSKAFWWEAYLPAWIGKNFDKVLHGGIYAVLGIFVWRALALGHSLKRIAAIVLALAICAAYGASDEWHQILTPGRSCDFYDWLADLVGSLAGILLVSFLYSKTQPSHNF
jgi:VanZ family protein